MKTAWRNKMERGDHCVFGQKKKRKKESTKEWRPRRKRKEQKVKGEQNVIARSINLPGTGIGMMSHVVSKTCSVRAEEKVS